MSRIAGVLVPLLTFVVLGCSMAPNQAVAAAEAEKDAANMTNEQKNTADTAEAEKVVKSDEEWRKQLTAEQYRVTRQCGTEPAFTGKYWNEKRNGTYVCVACGQPLFDSETKYDSGTGWPSFFAPVDKKVVEEREDNSLFTARTEILCSRCEAHLGHVFTDGPNPTGLRYCMNSASLNFVPEDEKNAAKSGKKTEKSQPEDAAHETSPAKPAE